MLYTEKIKLASDIMMRAHAGQVDKGGYPYVMHPIHLAEQLTFEDEIIVALLHDVMEDHPEFTNNIIEAGFNQEIIGVLTIINRHSTINSGKTYWEYIQNVATNRLATLVKLTDLWHNLDSTRRGPDVKSSMSKRYKKAYNYLIQKARTDFEIESIGIGEYYGIDGMDDIANWKVVISTPYYDGIIWISVKRLKRFNNFVVYAQGELGCKLNDFSIRKCNTSGHFNSRRNGDNKPKVKDISLIFKNTANNRDVRIFVNVDFETGEIRKVQLLDKPNSLPLEVTDL